MKSGHCHVACAAVRGRASRGIRLSSRIAVMSSGEGVEVTALAINVTIPESQRWTDTRRGERFNLTTLNVRLLPDGHLAVKAYGRPTSGGRSNYVPFPVPDDPELVSLIGAAAKRAGSLWAAHRGLR
jgi:uncharacterized protein YaiE (UPF0345 family)